MNALPKTGDLFATNLVHKNVQNRRCLLTRWARCIFGVVMAKPTPRFISSTAGLFSVGTIPSANQPQVVAKDVLLTRVASQTPSTLIYIAI